MVSSKRTLGVRLNGTRYWVFCKTYYFAFVVKWQSETLRAVGCDMTVGKKGKGESQHNGKIYLKFFYRGGRVVAKRLHMWLGKGFSITCASVLGGGGSRSSKTLSVHTLWMAPIATIHVNISGKKGICSM